MSIDCSFEDFKRMAKEFHVSAPTLNLDELDAAWKCLGLAYLGMREPMWERSAAIVLRMEARTFEECERALSVRVGESCDGCDSSGLQKKVSLM